MEEEIEELRQRIAELEIENTSLRSDLQHADHCWWEWERAARGHREAIRTHWKWVRWLPGIRAAWDFWWPLDEKSIGHPDHGKKR